MFSFKKKKSVLGMDIGTKATKVVQFSYNKSGQAQLERYGMIEAGLADEQFEGALKSWLTEQKIANALVASSIDDPSLKIRKIELPKMPEADLIEAIKWNLREIVEGDIDNFSINYSKIQEYEENDTIKIELLGYAINRQAVQEFQNKILKLGVQPFFIEPAAVTLASALDRCHGSEDNYTAGVNIGFSSSLFYVVGKKTFTFSRPLAGIHLKDLEKDKEGFNQKLAIEIQKSIDTFKVNFRMEEIQALYLSGGGALIPGIDEYLKTNMGIQTELLNPFANLSGAGAPEGVQPQLFAQAVSLAYLEP